MTLLRLNLKLMQGDQFSIDIEGGASEISTLPFFADEKLYAVVNILNNVEIDLKEEKIKSVIEGDLLSEGDTISELTHDEIVRKIGRKIFKSLFPEKIKEKLNMEIHNEFLHIQICYEDKESKLSLYPWHLACKGNTFLADEQNIYFSYLIRCNKSPKTLEKKKKAKVILIASDVSENPSSDGKISPEIFQYAIEKSIDKLTDFSPVYTKWDKPCFGKLEDFINKNNRKEDNNCGLIINFYGHGLFKRYCNNPKCKLYQIGNAIHPVSEKICGNCKRKLGEPQGHLLFQKDQGNGVEYIDSKRFAEKIISLKPQPVLAVITACHSARSYKGETVYNGIAQSLIDKGIPAVIGFPFRITEESSRLFIESFYKTLFQSNSSLFEAFKSGIQDCKAGEWYRPVLFLSQAVEDGKLFDFTESESPSFYESKPKSESESQPLFSYLLRINPQDYQKILSAYTYCCVLSKELETITIIFRQLDIKSRKNLTVYLSSLEQAKKTFRSIPNLNPNNQPYWVSRIYGNQRQDFTEYNDNYGKIKQFIESELKRDFQNSHGLDRNCIISLTDYNGYLENFWEKLCHEHLPK